jgi:hypothetical protein
MQGDDPDFARVIRLHLHRPADRAAPPALLLCPAPASGGRFHEDPRLYHLDGLASFFLRMLENALADISILHGRYADLQRLRKAPSPSSPASGQRRNVASRWLIWWRKRGWCAEQCKTPWSV